MAENSVWSLYVFTCHCYTNKRTTDWNISLCAAWASLLKGVNIQNSLLRFAVGNSQQHVVACRDFVALLSLFQGHVACRNLPLIRPYHHHHHNHHHYHHHHHHYRCHRHHHNSRCHPRLVILYTIFPILTVVITITIYRHHHHHHTTTTTTTTIIITIMCALYYCRCKIHSFPPMKSMSITWLFKCGLLTCTQPRMQEIIVPCLGDVLWWTEDNLSLTRGTESRTVGTTNYRYTQDSM